MKHILKYVAAVYIIMVIYYWMTDKPAYVPPPPSYKVSPRPDPNREVAHFSYEEWKYIYKDEIPKKGPIQMGPITSYPDLFVEGMSSGTYNYPSTIIIDKQRYRVRVNTHNNVTLIPTR
jgi:hypothetical protein